MKKPADIADAEHAVTAAKAKIGFIDAHISVIAIEIDSLIRLQNQFVENIETLKKNRIVAVASAYKQARADLTKTKNKLKMKIDERETLERSRKNAYTVLQKCVEAYDIILSRYQNNVLTGNFGSKNGGQR